MERRGREKKTNSLNWSPPLRNYKNTKLINYTKHIGQDTKELEIDFWEQDLTVALGGMEWDGFYAHACSDFTEGPQYEPKRKGRQTLNTTKSKTIPRTGFHTARLNQCSIEQMCLNQCFTEQVILLPHFCTRLTMAYAISCLVSSHTVEKNQTNKKKHCTDQIT